MKGAQMPSRRISRTGQVCVATALAFLVGCGSRETSPPAAETPATAPTAATPPTAAPVQIEMKNVRLHLDDGIVLDVRHLRGEMVSKAQAPPVFDDPRSYVLRVFTGELGMDMTSLTNLMNRHVFAYADAPLKDISVEIDAGRLRQQGKLHKGVWVPFSMNATPTATRDGRLLLHTESVSALGIPATKLLDLFGLTLADLITVEKQHGVEIKGDDVIISPGRVLPPPQIEGHLSRAEVANGELRQVFTAVDGRAVSILTPPDRKASNYVYLSGAIIRFGKLTMTETDLQLIDLDERDAFDFYPAKYSAQLVAGYSKNTPAQGLKTYMPDFADLKPALDLRPPGR
jgi:hypothetical protein